MIQCGKSQKMFGRKWIGNDYFLLFILFFLSLLLCIRSCYLCMHWCERQRSISWHSWRIFGNEDKLSICVYMCVLVSVWHRQILPFAEQFTSSTNFIRIALYVAYIRIYEYGYGKVIRRTTKSKFMLPKSTTSNDDDNGRIQISQNVYRIKQISFFCYFMCFYSISIHCLLFSLLIRQNVAGMTSPPSWILIDCYFPFLFCFYHWHLFIYVVYMHTNSFYHSIGTYCTNIENTLDFWVGRYSSFVSWLFSIEKWREQKWR